ncbi:MAG: sn-glycerol-3-phosphate ABC transporter ATP-binding protein UgpC [Ignavibacteriaceae bacterium]|nr:sn-glycerol-3-phosphate ABC transporter ATP-binding protein UgpC [Ignavibacteriaceae bacterium]
MAEVLLKNVSKIYEGKNPAVNKVNVEIKDKEFVVLVGPSGCGKTTLLRMIAGLEEITSGEIYIDDKIVNNIPPKDRDIAMVFQNYALYPHMSVFENIAFGLKLRKYDNNEIKKRVEEAAVILNLQDYLQRKPRQLSGGQRQRVAVGRAIVRKPKVFLFDEPLSNLDAKLRVQMRTEISKLHKNLGATMIYVTHDQTEAMTMGDKIVILKDGEVQQIGIPMELYNNPVNKFVAGFIGSPAMNLLTGKIEDKGKLCFSINESNAIVELNESQIHKLKKYSGREVLLGIRPEDIEPASVSDGVGNIKAEIEVVEPMGNETFLYFTLQNKQMIARVSSNVPYKTGEKLLFVPDKNKLHFFDYETGVSIQ